MAVAKPLHLRLFLEGIEVPVVSAQVSAGVNGPASAAVQIIPHDLALQFKPRTMVHLFYLDGDPSDEQMAEGLTLGEYRLLFAGELIAFSVQQTPMSRGIVLQCVDFSAYWDSCHATAIEYGPGGNAFTDTGWLVGSNTSQFDDIVNQQANKLVAWLRQAPKTPGLETTSGLAGGIIRILEAIGGLPGVEKGVNDFFTIAQLRCRVLEQIVAEENDSTAERLLSVQVFDEWVRNGLQNAGQQVTFRDLLKILFQYIYYEAVPNPAAMYEASTVGRIERQETVVTASLVEDPNGVAALSQFEALQARIQVDATRAVGEESLSEAVLGYRARVLRIEALLKKVESADSRDVRAHVSTLLSKIDGLLRLRDTSPSIERVKDLLPPMQSAIDRLKASTKVKTTRAVIHNDVLIGGRAPRLRSQIIRPDCWFAAPPVCNVIFPEQYVSFNYQRNYLSEVTRVLIQLYNSLIGPDRLLTNKILAPNAKQASARLGKYAGVAGYRILMDHEVHTGIIPREEFLPNTASTSADASKTDALTAKRDRLSWAQRVALFHYFRYRFASRSSSVGGKFNPNVVCGFPAAILTRPYTPEREIDRTDSVEAYAMLSGEQERFRYILDNATYFKAPVHYVGMVSSVSHSLDQTGGTTTVSLNHTRQIGGDDDEFIRMAQELKTVERTIQVTLDFGQIESLQDKKRKEVLLRYLVSCTPQTDPPKAKPAQTKKATPSSAGGAAVKEAKAAPAKTSLPLTKSYVQGSKTYVVPDGATKVSRGDAGVDGNGKVTLIEVADASIVSAAAVKAASGGVSGRAFRKVIVHETVDLPVNTKIPAEEVIRPRGWFSDKYANEAIGAGIYTPFFGCRSIIDSLRIQLGEKAIVANPTTDGDPKVDPTKAVNMVDAIAFDEAEKIFHSVERAMNSLAYIYGRVKAEGGDVDAFIRAYTRRPIATKDEILGSDDLELEVKSQSEIVATKGSFGFHTHAVHRTLVDRKEKLYGLVGDPTLKVARINKTGAASPYLGAYDVRLEKYQAVKAYADELRQRRAFQG